MPKFTDLEYVVLKIKELQCDNTYYKYFENEKDGQTDVVKMYIEHDPIPCNYSHTVFSFDLNGEKIKTIADFKQKFDQKRYKKLRQDCRLEIAKMIITNSIRIKYGDLEGD